ncbi:MAG: 50S ribosomal protein L10 [Candidatus Cloacimonetes bacterium]|nr:50S ribosomal protein L10 [Candidatus Cloacimonadota bacterium]
MEEKSINPKNIEAVENIKNSIQNAKSLILVDYKGLNVEEDTELRRKFRENNVNYFVCKNTFLKLATKDLKIDTLEDFLIGPTAVAVSKEEELKPAKIIADFAKALPEEKNLPKFKAGIIDDIFMDIEKLNEVVKLPSRIELLAKLISSLNSPISGLAISLNGILQKLLFVLNAIKDKSTKSGSSSGGK